MPAPVIEWYESTEAEAPLTSWDYGIVDEGTTSSVKKFFVYNNKGGSEGVSAATDLRYTAYDDAEKNEEGDVVTEKWLEVQLVSVNGTPPDPADAFEGVGGSNDANKKDWTSEQIAEGEYLEVDTRVAIPQDPDAGQRSFVQTLEYKYT